MKKKLIAVILSIIFMLCLASCRNKNEDDIRFYLPDNISTLSVVNILNEGLIYNNKNVEFVFEDTSKIEKYVNNNDFTFAICKTTTAALSHKSNKKSKILFNTSFGSSYIVSNKSKISSFSNLIGKTVYTETGFNSKMLQYLLKSNDILYTLDEEKEGYVYIEEVSNGNQIVSLYSSDVETISLINEPYLTKISKLANVSIGIDIQSEYKKINNYSYPEYSIVVSNSFAEDNAEFIEFLYEKLVQDYNYLYINHDKLNLYFKNLNLINLTGFSYDKSTIDRCNINVTKAYLHKDNVNNYVENFTNIKMDDEFYYQF